MCGRFSITQPRDAMAAMFSARPSNDLPDIPNYNVCPTTMIHVVIGGDIERQLVQKRWGFLPHWYDTPTSGPVLINARAETIAQKPAFAQACRTRRCLIPCDGFYEWTKSDTGGRLPWYITATSGAPLVFAGVWQEWGQGADRISTCAIVTTAANTDMARLHHRQPVVIAPKDWPLWLGEAGHGAARLMQMSDIATFTWHRVNPKVNSNRASGPELIEPFE